MLHRRSVIQAGFAALGAASVYAPSVLRAQNKPLVKIRYNEVVRSVLYAPAYVAITNGYFKEAGLDVEMTTANGGDKSMAALISGSADIALMGPEAAIYVLNSDSSVKARIFCGLTATDGFMLVGRTKVDKFDWGTLKGKDILGFRPGSTPLLFLEETGLLEAERGLIRRDAQEEPLGLPRKVRPARPRGQHADFRMHPQRHEDHRNVAVAERVLHHRRPRVWVLARPLLQHLADCV